MSASLPWSQAVLDEMERQREQIREEFEASRRRAKGERQMSLFVQEVR